MTTAYDHLAVPLRRCEPLQSRLEDLDGRRQGGRGEAQVLQQAQLGAHRVDLEVGEVGCPHRLQVKAAGLLRLPGEHGQFAKRRGRPGDLLQLLQLGRVHRPLERAGSRHPGHGDEIVHVRHAG